MTLSRKYQATLELRLEAVRKQFREAISQENARLVTLNLARHTLFSVGSGTTEHAADAEQRMTASDVLDLARLKVYRRQHTELPGELKDFINSLVGDTREQAVATSLVNPTTARSAVSWG